MKKLLLIIANILIIPPVAMYTYYTFSPAKQALDNPPTITTNSTTRVLGATDEQDQIYFTVNVPATFKQAISAPNVVYSVNGESGEITIDSSLKAGNGISIDGREITNTGILTLVAGTGITVDGNKITNSGITSLSAGTNISIDGNKINNTYSVDLTESGWTDSGTSVVLTTTTDTVTVGTITTGAITATSLITDGITITSGNSILPDTDLGSDLGSSALRFNNLWVANINSNSSQSFSGQTTFSYPPTDTTIDEASVLINPTTSAASGQLLGLAIAGYQKALIDEDGDITLGYSDLTSAPSSDYPLNIYGHSGTRVSFVDTSGNAYFGGNVGIQVASPETTLSLPIENTPATPTISFGGSFGSGYTGIYSQTLTALNFANAGVQTLALTTSKLREPRIAGSQWLFEVASATNPIFSPGSSDDDTGLGSAGTDILSLIAGGTNGLNVDGSGNVGIGTSSPGAKLNIYQDSPSANQILFRIGTSDNSSRFSIDEDGDVGATRYLMVNTTLANDNFSTSKSYAFINTGVADYFSWETRDPTQNESMRLTSYGNLGIGTTSPNNKLEILSTSDAQLRLAYDTSNYHTLQTSSDGGLVWSALGTDADLNFDFSGATDGDFSVNTDNLFVDTSTGYVGIGTTAPTASLTVNQAAFYSSAAGIKVKADGVTDFDFYITGGAVAIMKHNQNSIAMQNAGYTAFTTANSEAMRIDGTGNVGIGTTSPTYKLDVSGIIRSTAGLATYIKAGTISDSDFSETPLDGLMALDSTNGRLYFRSGGSWSYIAKTAGFQIPDYETEGLSEGDLLMPYVEKRMADGALHGLYTKFSKETVFSDELTSIASISAGLATNSAQIAEVTDRVSVLESLVDEIRGWIEELQNKWTALAESLTTKEMCIGEDGDKTCLNKEQVDQLLELLPSPTPTSTPVPSVSPSPSPTPSPSATSSPTLTPSPSPSPTPSPTP